jgi:hypothetical protein
MRHRYIFCGSAVGTDKLSDFRLIAKLVDRRIERGWWHCVRVNIPDDVELEHWNGDSYSTTTCEKTLEEVGYDCYIRYRNKWLKVNELKPYEPCDWSDVLEYGYGIMLVNKIGYGTSEDYGKWWRGEFDDIDPHVPFGVQDKETKLVLQPKGDSFHNYSHYMNQDWFKLFHEINNL